MASIFDLSNKVALVTGGSRGIGFGFADALAAAGSNVVIWGRDALRNGEAIERLKAHGTHVFAQTVDVTEETQVQAAMTEVVARLGRVDSVFACAGVAHTREPFDSMLTSTWRKSLATNLDGTFWTFREACRVMVARAKGGEMGGSLIAVSSLASLQGTPRLEGYAASKGAVGAVTRSLAVEFARYGIRANVVIPGWIETDMTATTRSSETKEIITRRIPARRWGSPEDLAGIAVYFASDASRYHSGDTVCIDGGYSVF